MSDSSQTACPKVSVLIPVYNEQQHITAALESIAGQDYPAECIEIVVAHGTSTDGTGELLQSFRRDHPDLAVTILDNPSNNTAVGRNICLQRAAGRLVLNFSGHAVADKNLLRVLVEKLDRLPEDAAGIGCAIRRPAASGRLEKAIAVAMYSPLGGGRHVDSAFHAESDQVACSVAFSLYKKDVLESLGGFDERYWCGQDAEVNLRLARQGYKLWFTPDAVVEHYKRTRLKDFLKQAYRYGVARAKISRKYPDSLRIVFLLPVLFTVACPLAVAVALANREAAVAVATVTALFVFAALLSAAKAGGDWLSVLLSPLVYGLLYVGYGTGFLRGLFQRAKQ